VTSRAVLREEQKTATRQPVLDAAVRVFTATPFVSAGVGDVATAADLCHLRALRENPDLVPKAVEELMRWCRSASAAAPPATRWRTWSSAA
jgi:hypothetical protein